MNLQSIFAALTFAFKIERALFSYIDGCLAVFISVARSKRRTVYAPFCRASGFFALFALMHELRAAQTKKLTDGSYRTRSIIPALLIRELPTFFNY